MEIINNKYKIIKKFNTSNNANTYLVLDITNNKNVIIKELIINNIKDWKLVELFKRETKVLKNLNHDFIPNYIDSFYLEQENKSSFYLVQEYIEGRNLQERIDDGEMFSIETTYSVLETILEILSYLENLNPPVIHRDIKPSNIIMTDYGNIYLIDFGAIQNVGNLNHVGTTVVGTTGFMAPEQLMGRATTKSDLYSLGVTIIALLSHKNPMDLPIKNMKIQYDDYINSNIDDNFKNFIDKLTEPDKDKRINSPEEALLLLQKVKNGKSIENPNNTHKEIWDNFEEKKQRNHSKPLTIFSIFFILLVLSAAFFLISKAPDRKMPRVTEIKDFENLKTNVSENTKENITSISSALQNCFDVNINREKVSSAEDLKYLKCDNFNLGNENLTAISELTSLTSLNLGNNNINDISFLKNLKNLQLLTLNNNNIEDISVLKNLKNLKSLYIYKNKISNLSSLSGLKNLKNLALFSNNISNIEALSKLTNLERLTISFNKISNLSPLKNLTNLKYLNSNYSKIEDLKPLKDLKNLKDLDLGHNNISSLEGIENLTNLKRLKTGYNNISDISLLNNLTEITWLDISHNNISDISVLKNLKNIKYLIISNNNIEDISAISKLKYLETLWAGQNRIKSIPDLKNLKNIKRLSLWDNQISDLSPLKNINITEELNISRNPVNDFSPVSHITNVKK